MPDLTLDQVLTCAEALPAEEQDILVELLKRRRIETWRDETAAYVREVGPAYRAGKLKAQSASATIARLRAGLKKNAE